MGLLRMQRQAVPMGINSQVFLSLSHGRYLMKVRLYVSEKKFVLHGIISLLHGNIGSWCPLKASQFTRKWSVHVHRSMESHAIHRILKWRIINIISKFCQKNKRCSILPFKRANAIISINLITDYPVCCISIFGKLESSS